MYEENMISETNGIPLNEVMRRDLAVSAKWAKFIFVLSMIFIVLGIIVFLLSSLAAQAGSTKVRSGIYTVVLLMYIYPTVKGLHFAKSLKNACSTGSQSELEQAFAALRPCVVWYTALAIVDLAMSLLS